MDNDMYILAYDFGTGGIKASLYDAGARRFGVGVNSARSILAEVR